MMIMKTTNQTDIKISGMSCSGCANTVEQALTNLEGIEQAAVDHQKGTTTVSYQTGDVSVDDFKRAVEDAGYSFEGVKE